MTTRDHTARIELRTLPFVTVLAYQLAADMTWAPFGKKGQWVVKVGADLPDSDTGAPGSYGVTDVYGWRRAPGRAMLGNAVRRALRRCLLHEIDEGLRVDGKRARPPHRI